LGAFYPQVQYAEELTEAIRHARLRCSKQSPNDVNFTDEKVFALAALNIHGMTDCLHLRQQ